jgi:transcriptional regulator
MYLPAHFREDRLEALHALIAARPLGTLIAQGPTGLDASLVPFLVDAEASPRGTLRAHLARANGQWRTLAAANEAMVVFQDQGVYVSPGWYATKRETGKVVPTWNYVAVACWGRPTIIEDAGWLRALVDAVTARHERGRAAPWAMTDAPPTFIEGQLKGIVGLEIPIARIEGKWKASQNRAAADRAGVAEGLDAEGTDAAHAMADLVRRRD